MREQGRHLQRAGEMLGDAGCPDVVGDVPAEIFRREAEGAIGWRNSIVGVVAEKEHAALPVSVDAPERRRHLLLPQPIKPLLHRVTSYCA